MNKNVLVGVVLSLAFVSVVFGQNSGAPAQLAIEAGVVMKSGDVKRVARTEFLLLDADFGAMLVRQGKARQVEEGVSPNTDLHSEWLVLTMQRMVLTLPKQVQAASEKGVEQSRRAVAEADAFLKRHTVARATTDFEGKGSFRSVPAGAYYLFGAFEVFKDHIVWNVPVKLKPGGNRLFLDNQNAVVK